MLYLNFNCNLNFKYFIAKYWSNMPAGEHLVLKCFPSLSPHTYLICSILNKLLTNINWNISYITCYVSERIFAFVEIERNVNSGLIWKHNFVLVVTVHLQANSINTETPLPKCTSLQPAIYRCDLPNPANGKLCT